MKIEKLLTLVGLILITGILTVSIFNMTSGLIPVVKQPDPQPNLPNNQNPTPAQTIQLGYKNYAYYFPSTGSDTLTIKKDQPVKLELLLNGASPLAGCTKAVKMPPELGGQLKIAKAGDNILEFTPTKTGNFGFACAMGMARGSIIVL